MISVKTARKLLKEVSRLTSKSPGLILPQRIFENQKQTVKLLVSLFPPCVFLQNSSRFLQ